MRTTVDLPEDVLRCVKNIAHDRRTSVSKVISELVTNAVKPEPAPEPRVVIDPQTGLATIRFGRIITMADVQEALDDE